jgi:ATP phosphoribosyltransferase regulatory subunit
MPMDARRWLLPEYVEDILPPEAQRLEELRSRLLGLFAGHGYQLVAPPLLEYLESLLTGTGHDLDLRTFKLVDQLSGRTLGVRADITPQVARIDAHLLNRSGVTRLCYCGSVLHAVPAGTARTREPLQIGAELYGHAGPESDVEIQRLMLEALRAAGLEGVHLDLGHVGLFRALARAAGVDAVLEAALFQALQGKDVPELVSLTAGLPAELREAVRLLPSLYGGAEVLQAAAERLPGLPEVARSLAELRVLVNGLEGRVGDLLVDLAELRGYHYHSGVVFAAYAPGSANAIALGGRYDEVGRAFGRARPATGFSIDLRELAALSPQRPGRRGILVPCSDDASLAAEVARLRAAGEVVIADLPGHEDSRHELDCDRQLVRDGGGWRIAPMEGA